MKGEVNQEQGAEGRHLSIQRRSSLAANIDFGKGAGYITPHSFIQSLPSFFIIGPARTGSSWLHKVLSEHTVLPSQKETYFFDSYFHRGIDWYRACYASLGENRRMGEVAPTYFASAKARERIARTIPDAKVVCTFRDPVERVWSLYRLRRAHARIPWSFEEAMVRDPELMETSRYATHLKSWQTSLGREQVQVTMYEDLRSDPQSYVDALVNFIDIPRFPLRNENLRYTYSSDGEKLTYPRNQLVMRIARTAADGLQRRNRRLFGVVSSVKKFPLTGRLISGGQAFEKLSPEITKRLRELFRPEVEELETILNRDLTAWKYPVELRDTSTSLNSQ